MVRWFGGGTDITTSYVEKDDTQHFHETYKEVCDRHNKEYYPRFTKWANKYFTIQHRGDTGGIGGIFF
jgi:coproporphyrinogen III oxidase